LFVDTAKVYVKGGDGGNGIVSFRREKYVPEGGPAGGDGGEGGDVIFQVDEGLRTLLDFKYQRHYKAERGEYGGTKNKHGKNAPDMIVKVPQGTIVRDAEDGSFIGDLVSSGQRIVIAEGGRGGRGNTRFATIANKAPNMAEKGEPGQERMVLLELKVMADVGLVGFPSVGKSTLLSVVSAAQPKIGAYHFTTLSPNLGLVGVDDGRSFVLADLPGLIEGAHTGLGLGHQFLRHIERTKVIVHVVDMSSLEGRDPYDDWVKINEELKLHDTKLESMPQIIAANKMDLPGAEDHLSAFRAKVKDVPIFPISGVTQLGVKELMFAITDLLEKVEQQLQAAASDANLQSAERKVYFVRAEENFRIVRDNETYVVQGAELEKLMKMTNFMQEDAIQRFQRIMKRMGVDDALRARGCTNGTTVRIGEFEFEFVE